MKKSLLSLLLIPSLSYGADVAISALPAGGALGGTEAIPAVQTGATVKTTPNAISTYLQATTQTLTNKTISGASNTLSNIANSSLSNSAITINGTATSLGGTRTLALASADFVNNGTTTTVLHGNAAGNPSFGAVALAADVSGTLPLANGGGLTTATDDAISVGNGTILQSKVIPTCTDTGGNHLNYDASTNTFSCGTSPTTANGSCAGTLAVTASVNVTTASTTGCRYQRLGTTVILWAAVNITATGSGDTQATFTLPIASTLSTFGDLAGTLVTGQTTNPLSGAIYNNSSVPTMRFQVAAGGANTFMVNATYIIN